MKDWWVKIDHWFVYSVLLEASVDHEGIHQSGMNLGLTVHDIGIWIWIQTYHIMFWGIFHIQNLSYSIFWCEKTRTWNGFWTQIYFHLTPDSVFCRGHKEQVNLRHGASVHASITGHEFTYVWWVYLDSKCICICKIHSFCMGILFHSYLAHSQA